LILDYNIEPTLPRKTPRAIRIEGEYAFIPLTKGFEARIDAVDVPLVKGRNWTAIVIGRKVKRVYAAVGVRVGKGKTRLAYLHRVLCPGGIKTDHEDGDTLNNTRPNLRPCNSAQNAWNSAPQRRSKTGVKGVFPSGRFPGRYRVALRKGGKVYFDGDNYTLAEATAAYDRAAAEAFGEFAYLNASAPARARVV